MSDDWKVCQTKPYRCSCRRPEQDLFSGEPGACSTCWGDVGRQVQMDWPLAPSPASLQAALRDEMEELASLVKGLKEAFERTDKLVQQVEMEVRRRAQ